MTSRIGIPASRAGAKSCHGFENRSGSEAPDKVGDCLHGVEGRQNLALKLFLIFKRPPGKAMSTFDSSLHLRSVFADLRACTVGFDAEKQQIWSTQVERTVECTEYAWYNGRKFIKTIVPNCKKNEANRRGRNWTYQSHDVSNHGLRTRCSRASRSHWSLGTESIFR